MEGGPRGKDSGFWGGASTATDAINTANSNTSHLNQSNTQNVKRPPSPSPTNYQSSPLLLIQAARRHRRRRDGVGQDRGVCDPDAGLHPAPAADDRGQRGAPAIFWGVFLDRRGLLRWWRSGRSRWRRFRRPGAKKTDAFFGRGEGWEGDARLYSAQAAGR